MYKMDKAPSKVIKTKQNLLEVLEQEYLKYIESISKMSFTEEQNIELHNLKNLYSKGQYLNFNISDTNITKSAVLNYNLEGINSLYYTYENLRGYFLSKSELRTILTDGILEPKPLAYYPSEFGDKLYNEVMSFIDYYESVKTAELSRLGFYFLPTVLQLLKENLEIFIQSSISIYNTTRLFFTAQPFRVNPGEGLYHLHSDYTYADDILKMKLLNYHIALTKVTYKSSPIKIFPKTHTDIITQEFAYKYILSNNLFSEKDRDLFLKAYVCAYKFTGDVPENYINIRQQTPYKYDYAPCGKPFIYKYYLEKFSGQDIKSIYTENERGEYTLFVPSLLHYSLTTNLDSFPRVSMVIRTLDMPGEIEFGELISLINLVYKEFLQQNLNLNIKQITEILFNNQYIDYNSMVLSAIALNDEDCALPCITIERLEDFYCRTNLLDNCKNSLFEEQYNKDEL